MGLLSPICFASDDKHLYAASFASNAVLGDVNYGGVDLIVARSTSTPSSLQDLNWSFAARSTHYPLHARDQNTFEFTYTCAWSPQTSTFVVIGQSAIGGSSMGPEQFMVIIPVPPAESLPQKPYPDERVSIAASRDDVNSQDGIASGHSVLFPVSQSTAPTTTTGQTNRWLRVHAKQATNTILLTLLDDGPVFPGQAQIKWSMDATQFGQSQLLASTANNLLLLGSRTDNGHLRLITLPLDTASIPSTPPTVSPGQILDTDIVAGQDCDLSNDRTVMHAIRERVYLMCFQPTSASNLTSAQSIYNIYSFNSTSSHRLGTVLAEEGDRPGSNTRFDFVPVPSRNDSSVSPWIYIYSSQEHGLQLNISGSTLGYDTEKAKQLYIDEDYFRLPPQPSPSVGSDHESNIQGHGFTGIWWGLSGVILVTLLAVAVFKFTMARGRWRWRKDNSKGKDDDSVDLELQLPREERAERLRRFHESRERAAAAAAAASEASGEGGVGIAVSRIAYGEDALHSLPRYSPRARRAAGEVSLRPGGGQEPAELQLPPSYTEATEMIVPEETATGLPVVLAAPAPSIANEPPGEQEQ
ncbi:hypothetical protein EDD11_000456 [Mortierella claussenii]|nr:hypothetical protein EDD11_000456 [Mortierella claussenii]